MFLLQPLDEASLKEVEAAIKQLAKGKQILLTTKVNPNILGGLTVKIGDRYADMSIASKLKKYSDILNAAV